ncbi:MAG: hypothetical protein K8U57_01965 [Planctomycetes bacterium]|nr:hypothetical protein [Planctomycetota bacterium]
MSTENALDHGIYGMKCPASLTGEARKFFNRHPPWCESDGTLTDATLDSFVLLCRTWAMVVNLDPDDDTPRITVRFTSDGRLMGIEVDDALADWLWPCEQDGASQ